MRLTKFGTITLPELNGRDNGIGSQGRSNIIPLRDGGYDLDGSSVFLEPMTISRSAVLTDSIDSTLDNLFGEMRKGRMVLQSEMRDGSLRHTFAKMALQMRDISADKYLCEQPVNLQWIANYPYWLKSDEDFYYFDHGITFDTINPDTGLTYSFDDTQFEQAVLSSGSLTDNIVIDNDSKFRIYRIFLSFRAFDPFSTSNFVVKNITNGCEVHFNSTLDTSTGIAGDIKLLWIDCLSKFAMSSNQTNEYENIEIVGGNGLDWFWLEAGENEIEVSAETGVGAGGLVMRAMWATHYL
jgi:hypothetical protein